MVTGHGPGAGGAAAPSGVDERERHKGTTPAGENHAHGAWPVTTWQGRQHFATTPPPVPPGPRAPGSGLRAPGSGLRALHIG